MTTVYLVRHGQTAWNVERRFQGSQDSPLTALGLNQAEWLCRSLRAERIDVVYASPSARARRTAEMIRGDRDIPLIDDQALKEMNLGVWEGITQEEAKALDPAQFKLFWQDPEAFEVEGSERLQAVSDRVVALLGKVLREHRGETILLATHSVVVKLIMAFFEGRPLNAIWEPPYIHPASLCKIAITGERADILLHGDVSHYPEPPEALAD